MSHGQITFELCQWLVAGRVIVARVSLFVHQSHLGKWGQVSHIRSKLEKSLLVMSLSLNHMPSVVLCLPLCYHKAENDSSHPVWADVALKRGLGGNKMSTGTYRLIGFENSIISQLFHTPKVADSWLKETTIVLKKQSCQDRGTDDKIGGREVFNFVFFP